MTSRHFSIWLCSQSLFALSLLLTIRMCRTFSLVLPLVWRRALCFVRYWQLSALTCRCCLSVARTSWSCETSIAWFGSCGRVPAVRAWLPPGEQVRSGVACRHARLQHSCAPSWRGRWRQAVHHVLSMGAPLTRERRVFLSRCRHQSCLPEDCRVCKKEWNKWAVRISVFRARDVTGASIRSFHSDTDHTAVYVRSDQHVERMRHAPFVLKRSLTFK